MISEGHKAFGRALNEVFDVPERFIKWTVGPDYGYWLKYGGLRKIFHRFTLHGLDNVENCIQLLKSEDKFIYDEDYRLEIEFMVASHSYLDLFNGPIGPSYKSNLEFKGIPRQTKHYLRPLAKPPDGLEEALEEGLKEFKTIEEAKGFIEEEYQNIPGEYRYFTKNILTLYK